MTTDRPFHELSDEGLLWLINRTTFHPRGYALSVNKADDGTWLGWNILGDGTEVWTFSAEADDEEFAKVAAFFANLPPEGDR